MLVLRIVFNFLLLIRNLSRVSDERIHSLHIYNRVDMCDKMTRSIINVDFHGNKHMGFKENITQINNKTSDYD